MKASEITIRKTTPLVLRRPDRAAAKPPTSPLLQSPSNEADNLCIVSKEGSVGFLSRDAFVSLQRAASAPLPLERLAPKNSATQSTIATATSASVDRPEFVLDAKLQGSIPFSTADVFDFNNGDGFGFGFALNDDELFVGSVFARPQMHDIAGASYFFQRQKRASPGTAWIQSQTPYTVPVNLSSVGLGRYATGDGWLFVPQQGTPNDSTEKDFSGEVLVFRKEARHHCHEGAHEEAQEEDRAGRGQPWRLFQRIANPNPRPFALFGYNLSYSQGRLLAGATSDNHTYLFQLNEAGNAWELKTALPVPLAEPGTATILDVLIRGDWAFVGFTDDSQIAPGRVAVYRFSRESEPNEGGVITQILAGNDIGGVEAGDFFGAALSLHRRTLVVGAPYDHKFLPGGAAYVFQLCEGRWLLAQKIYSDAPLDPYPSHFGFGLNLAIRDDILAIADPLRPLPNPYGPSERNLEQGVVSIYRKDPRTREWVFSGDLLVDPDGYEGELFGAGGVQITDKYIAVGSFGHPIFLEHEIYAAQPGRLLIWRKVEREKRCEEVAVVAEEEERPKENAHGHHRKTRAAKRRASGKKKD